jgi:hypothetical protein
VFLANNTMASCHEHNVFRTTRLEAGDRITAAVAPEAVEAVLLRHRGCEPSHRAEEVLVRSSVTSRDSLPLTICSGSSLAIVR